MDEPTTYQPSLLTPDVEKTARKPYKAPAILHELELETRAGSPIGPNPDSIDPLGLTGLDG